MKNNAAGAKPATRQVVINLTPAQYDAIARLTVEFRASVGEIVTAAGLAFLEMHASEDRKSDDDCLALLAALTAYVSRRLAPEISRGDLNSHAWGVREDAPNRNALATGGAA